MQTAQADHIGRCIVRRMHCKLVGVSPHQEGVHADAGGGALQRRHEAVPHVAPQLRVQPALLLRVALQQVQHLQALRSMA